MKAHRQETTPAFVPVIITLESQEEVDEMYALLNHAYVCPDESPLYVGDNVLDGHANEAMAGVRHTALNKRLLNFYLQ